MKFLPILKAAASDFLEFQLSLRSRVLEIERRLDAIEPDAPQSAWYPGLLNLPISVPPDYTVWMDGSLYCIRIDDGAILTFGSFREAHTASWQDFYSLDPECGACGTPYPGISSDCESCREGWWSWLAHDAWGRELTAPPSNRGYGDIVFLGNPDRACGRSRFQFSVDCDVSELGIVTDYRKSLKGNDCSLVTVRHLDGSNRKAEYTAPSLSIIDDISSEQFRSIIAVAPTTGSAHDYAKRLAGLEVDAEFMYPGMLDTDVLPTAYTIILAPLSYEGFEAVTIGHHHISGRADLIKLAESRVAEVEAWLFQHYNSINMSRRTNPCIGGTYCNIVKYIY